MNIGTNDNGTLSFSVYDTSPPVWTNITEGTRDMGWQTNSMKCSYWLFGNNETGAGGGNFYFQGLNWNYSNTNWPQTPIITTVAGNSSLGGSFSGDGGLAVDAGLNLPVGMLDGGLAFSGIAVDASGNLYIADSGNNVIRMVNPSGYIHTVAGNVSLGGGYSGDGGLATSAQLSTPAGLALDGSGNLYIADHGNNVIRMLDTSGYIWTVAGGGSGGALYSGPATSAGLSQPTDVAVDSSGDIYIADHGNEVVRKVDTSGNVSTVAGFGVYGSTDGVPATSAQFDNLAGVTTDSSSVFCLSDADDSVVREIITGDIWTVAGTFGESTDSGDGGAATSAGIRAPVGIVKDAAGNLYISDEPSSVVRMVDTNGIIWRVAGNYSNSGYSGDGGPAAGASLSYPSGVAVDGSGNLFIIDTGNNVVRKVTFHNP